MIKEDWLLDIEEKKLPLTKPYDLIQFMVSEAMV